MGNNGFVNYLAGEVKTLNTEVGELSAHLVITDNEVQALDVRLTAAEHIILEHKQVHDEMSARIESVTKATLTPTVMPVAKAETKAMDSDAVKLAMYLVSIAVTLVMSYLGAVLKLLP